MSTNQVSDNPHPDRAEYELFSESIVFLKSQGAKCPSGSNETIFSLSAHCGNGPMLEAGSVFVKSGLSYISFAIIWLGFCLKSEAHGLLMVKFYLLAGYSKSIVYRIRSAVCYYSSVGCSLYITLGHGIPPMAIMMTKY